MKENSKKPQFRLILLAVLVGGLSALTGIWFWQATQKPPESAESTLLTLPEPRVIADFSLIDDHGQPFSLERLRGKWSLLFFGFTHCPDICPTALYGLQQVNASLERDRPEVADDLQVLFVSVDPERDTPQQLQKYVSFFDPEFTGVTGPFVQLQPLTLQLGVAYRIEPHEAGSTGYNVDHSASILLMNPDGRLHGVFPAPHNPERMAADLVAVIN